ncbi:MAG TPA: hypothetical protein VGG62_09840 [Terracidiphilus sp.]|jgi:hypothetical protein
MTTEIESRLKEELDKMKVAAYENPAVARCARAWMLFYCEVRLKGESVASARSRAAQAYRVSMPPLTGKRNVRDFIACATHGMLLGALDLNEGAKLLNAAQVAHTARRTKTNTKKAVQKPVSPVNQPRSKQLRDA